MPQNRVDKLLHFYFKRPYVEYGEVVLEIKENGGLTADEVLALEGQVLHIDANTMIRQSGTTHKKDNQSMVV